MTIDERDRNHYIRVQGKGDKERLVPVPRVWRRLQQSAAPLRLGFEQSPLTDEFVRAADVAISMGCGDGCPIYPLKRYEDWELEDPGGKGIDEMRRIREDIAGRVDKLIAEQTSPVRS